MQSDSFKKNYNDEILTHGEDAVNDLFGDFYGDGVGTGIGDKVLWTSTNKLLGKTYGNDVFSLAALKNAKQMLLQMPKEDRGLMWFKEKIQTILFIQI